MAKEIMRGIELLGPYEYKKEILELLQNEGVLELRKDRNLYARNEKERLGLHYSEEKQSERELLEKIKVCSDAAAWIQKFSEGSFSQNSEENKEFLLEELEEYYKIAFVLSSWGRELSELETKEKELETEQERLAPWIPFEIPVEYQSLTSCDLWFVVFPYADKTKEKETDFPYGIKGGITKQSTKEYCFLLFRKGKKAMVEEWICKENGEVAEYIKDIVPKQKWEQYEKEKQQIAYEKENLKQKIVQKKALSFVLPQMICYYENQQLRNSVEREIPYSSRVFYVSGYMKAKDVKELRKKMQQKYAVALVDFEVTKEEEKRLGEMPVALKNSSLAQSVYGVLEAFGLPTKREIDPSFVMSWFYIFFFGLMLSDAGYGALLAIFSLWMKGRYRKKGKEVPDTLTLFFYCGISTLLWGIAFGGYFGDGISVIAKVFFQKNLEIKALWFVPLMEPMRMLVYALGFGLVHLFTGLFLKGYLLIRENRWKDAFFDVVSYFLLLFGLLIVLLQSELFQSVAQMKFDFSASVMFIAKLSVIIGALLVLFTAGRHSKKIGVRIALGMYELYNLTGWVSDVLSYSRLLALGLATGVIAQVVNQMGSMVAGGFWGNLLFLLIFVVGHSFNLAINVLGAYVHTNRLQYVEFFGKFYKGVGTPFRPFSLKKVS